MVFGWLSLPGRRREKGSSGPGDTACADWLDARVGLMEPALVGVVTVMVGGGAARGVGGGAEGRGDTRCGAVLIRASVSPRLSGYSHM